jgi:Histidine kinase/Y_Y_Y domain
MFYTPSDLAVQKNKLIILFCLLLQISNSYAQEIRIDSVVVPKMKAYSRMDRRTIKNIGKSIDLKATENYFIIYFHSSRQSNLFAYKMEGLEDNFTETKNNFVYYSNYPDGEYTFIVKDKSNPSLKPAMLKVVVLAPFWQQWWVVPLVFLFITGIIGIVFYLFFLYRTQQKLHLQSVKYELEIKALRAQMNPHFIFNSINTIDALILDKCFIEASDLLQKFSELIRITLENSQYNTISIAQELKTLELYIQLEQERFPDIFTYQFEIQPVLLEKNYQIPPLLLQPFIENAILHGLRGLRSREGLLKITLKTAEVSQKKEGITEVLFCRIEDNGIGREASKAINEHNLRKHKSMGLGITFERIEKYQAKFNEQFDTQIIDLKGDKTGTIVEFKLPLLVE